VPVSSAASGVMPPRQRKAQGGKETSDADVKPGPVASPVSAKPKSAEGGSAWGRPRDGNGIGGLPRAPGAAPPTAPSISASAAAKAKVVLPAKTPVNIAAQAARNLGGFVPNKIFVGGVPITCTEDQFKSFFEPYGAISKVELHALRGFGYITYEQVESVDSCLEKYEEHYLSKKWVEVKRSIPRELIDAYEREQKRLHAEYLASAEGSSSGAAGLPPPSMAVVDGHGEGYAKAEPHPPAPTASAWGASPSSSVARKGAGPKGGGKGEPGGAASTSRIAQLKEMGFSDEVAKRVLAECAWDVNAAIDRLLLSGAMSTDSGGGDGGGDSSVGASEPAEAIMGPAPAVWPAVAPAPAAAATTAPLAPVHQEAPAPPPPPPPADASVEKAQSQAGAGEGSGLSNGLASGTPGHADAVLGSAYPPPPVEDGVLDGTGPEAGEAPLLASIEATASSVLDHDSAPATETTADATNSLGAAAETAIESTPKKRLERVNRTWNAEDPSQMSVTEKEYVYVWLETGTDNGWIHAESQSDGGRVGWLPRCILKELPQGQRFMRISQEWKSMDESQLSAEEGVSVVAWVSSRTPEGWCYVEMEQKDGDMKTGWLPVFCMEWNDL